MKRYIIRSLFVASLFCSGEIFAQETSRSGHFDLQSNVVRYKLSVANVKNTMSIELKTTDPAKVTGDSKYVSVTLLNESNVMIQTQMATVDNTNTLSFDMSHLPSGNYHVDIQNSSMAVLQSVPFTK